MENLAMRRRTKEHRGFSLVELLIAFFVLLVGVLSVLVLFPLGLRESKTMVDSSMASFVSRNARSLMETQPFSYHSAGSPKSGWGTAARIQATIGPKMGTNGVIPGNFPVMFPTDVLGNSDDGIFPLGQRPPDNETRTRDRVRDTSNTQFSWDARFTVPRSSIGGMTDITAAPGFTVADMDYWFTQYFKYYAVQISVYRNYSALKANPGDTTPAVMSGTVWVRVSGNYDMDDPNRPLYSEVVLTSAPPADLSVNSSIRVRDDKSDWYRVTAVSFNAGSREYHIRLDRPYAGLTLSNTQTQRSVPKSNIIATNSLVESFTTILASQLDDIDTSQVTYP
jgi:type II secretory pathway pseudopilin PulG